MTQDAETVARLEALEEKATAGKWFIDDAEPSAIYDHDSQCCVAAYCGLVRHRDTLRGTYIRSEDAALIVALRNEALPLIRSLSTRLAAAEAREAGLRARVEEWRQDAAARLLSYMAHAKSGYFTTKSRVAVGLIMPSYAMLREDETGEREAPTDDFGNPIELICEDIPTVLEKVQAFLRERDDA